MIGPFGRDFILIDLSVQFPPLNIVSISLFLENILNKLIFFPRKIKLLVQLRTSDLLDFCLN